MRRFVVIVAAAVNLTLVDAIVKKISAALFSQGAVSVLDGFFNLAYVENRGCAWGMLQGQVWPLAAFGAVALAALVWKRKEVFGTAGFAAGASEALLYAGILGNLLDRVFRGYVIDMFDFHWGVHHFPCFNLADAYITTSVAIMFALGIFSGDGKSKSK